MSERGSGKSRKATVSRTPASKQQVGKGASTKGLSTKTLTAKDAAKKATKASARPPSKSRTSSVAKTGRLAKQAAEGAPLLDAPTLMARVIKLESERDRLQRELADAVNRIRLLEESREQVVNRIDWVIDSLRNLIDD